MNTLDIIENNYWYSVYKFQWILNGNEMIDYKVDIW